MATALTATLRADITQFERAILQAETKITGLQRSTTQVNKELAKFGNDFGGATLIRQANLMAKAVEDLGGVTKLTAAEQKKLGATVDEALAKYRVLGKEVPPDLVVISTELVKIRAANEAAEKSAKAFGEVQKRAGKDAEDALKRPGVAAAGLSSGLGALGGAVAAAFSVRSIISFGKEIVALGGELTDLAARTGLTVEQVQTFSYAAEQTGATLDDIGIATEKLSDKLVSGDKSAGKALERIGLTFEELRALSPADAFTRVADAVGQVADPMERTNLALDLFGKSGGKILPAITEGFSGLTEEAKKLGQVLSDEDVKALDDFGDAWDRATKQFEVASVKAASGIADAFKQSWGTILADQADALTALVSNFDRVKATLADPNRLIFGAAAGLLTSGARTKAEAKAASAPTDDEGDEMFKAALKRSGSPQAARDYTDALKALRAEVDGLTVSQKANIVAGDKTNESNKDIAATLHISEAAVKSYLEQLKAAETASKSGFTAGLKKQAEEARNLAADLEKLGGVTKLDAEQRKAANKTLTEGVAAFKLLGQSATPAAQKVHELFRATTDLKEPLRNDTNEIERMVGSIKKLTTPTLEPWLRLTDTLAGGKGGVQNGLSEAVEHIIKDLPKLEDPAKKFATAIKAAKDELKNSDDSTKQWVGTIGNVSSAFAALAQVGGGSLDGIIGQVAKLVGLMNVGAQAGAGLRGVFGQGAFNGTTKGLAGFRNESGGFSAGSIAAGSAQAFVQGASAVSSLEQATNVKGRGNRAARGALTGAAIGNSIVPGYGALVGAAVGALVGAFRNPAFEDVYNRVAKDFGVKLSDETAKGIAKVAKDQFKGDRSAAEVFSLDTIIGEGGGLKDSNINLLTKRLRDAFSMKDVGKFSADQLEEVLEKNFGTFADFVGRSTTIAGKGFSEIARLAKAAGADIESIKAFVGQQTNRVGGGLADLAQPLLDSAGLGEQVKAAKAAADAAAAAVGQARGGKADEDLGVGDRQAVAAAQAEAAKAAAELEAITAKMAGSTKDAQAEFDRLGIIAVGAFNAARASGLGFLEATDQLSPGLDRLVAIQDQLGLSGNKALDELLKFRDLVGTNETVVASAEALNETILALSNIGGLTTETLSALEGQGVETFDRLTAAGFTSGQSIEIMRGFIENLKLAHEQLGVPIDANTQALIDQADALEGLAPKSPAEALTAGFERVATAVDRLAAGLGIAVPAAADAAAAAVETATRRSSSAAEDAAQVIATKGGEAWDTYARAGVDAQREVSDKIKEAAERGTVYTKKLGDLAENSADDVSLSSHRAWQDYYRYQEAALSDAQVDFRTFSDEANEALANIDRTVEIELHYRQTGDVPGGAPPGGGDTPGLATGGIVRARAGGTIVRLGEGGRDEAVIPLGAGGGQGVTLTQLVAALKQVQFTGTLEGRPVLRYVARELGDFIQTRSGQRVPF